MNLEELQDKTAHARRLGHSYLPEISFSDFPALLNHQKDKTEPYLIYIDKNDHRKELNYKDFCDQVYGVARFMQSHGLSHGDSIAAVSHNHWQTVIQYFAAWLLGLVVVPVNLEEDDPRIADILDDTNVELAFVQADYRKRMNSILESNNLKKLEVVVCDETTENYNTTDGELELPGEPLAESPALIVFTSGTMDDPKGVVLSQRNLLEEARSLGQWNRIDEETRMMGVLPVHHADEIILSLITSFFFGSSVVLNRRFRAGRFFSVIRQEEVHAASVDSNILQLLNDYYENGEETRPQTPTLAHIICSAGPLNLQLIEEFEERMNTRVIHGYGLSETSCGSCFIPLDLHEDAHKKWRSDFDYPSVGVDISVNQIEIHDPDGNALGENERGEIVIRGVNVMKGYYNNRQANEEVFKHGWLRSGDEGFFVQDGIGRNFFFITGKNGKSSSGMK
jgi:long-chain acyl-CoA synthetase